MRKYATSAHVQRVITMLDARFPDATCALNWKNPLELLIATILSAQCTDARVNIVVQSLFQKYRTAADYANVPLAELEDDIRSTGFYHNKAKNIQACCRILAEQFNGEVPADMDTLVQLPGIGRKTANCVLGTAYGIAEGVTVDTHVARLAQRMGLSKETTPEKIEADLMKLVPKDRWVKISHQLILHGRGLCPARKPRCAECLATAACREFCKFGEMNEAAAR